MSCECLVLSLLIESRASIAGGDENQGAAQSCAFLDDDAHPTYANSKWTRTYSGGYTYVIDYSTNISVNSGVSCPATTATWTPDLPVGTDPGTELTSIWSDPVQLSDVRAAARAEVTYYDWGTPPDFGSVGPGPAAGYNADWWIFQGGEALANFQSNYSLGEYMPGEAYDICTTVSGNPLQAFVSRQQVRFTLGPPKLPIKVTWDIVNTTDNSVISSDSVLLTAASPTHEVTVKATENSDATNEYVQMRNIHVFACPYHLS